MQIGFNIQLNLDAANPEDLARVASAVFALGQAVKNDNVEASVSEPEPPVVADISGGKVTRKTGPKGGVAKAKAEQLALPLEAPAPAASAPAPTSSDVPTINEVREAAAVYAKHFGAPEGFIRAADLIKELGGTKVSDIPAEKRAEFIARVVAKTGKKA